MDASTDGWQLRGNDDGSLENQDRNYDIRARRGPIPPPHVACDYSRAPW